MTAELWLRKPCEHGNLQCWEQTPLNDNLDPPMRTCPGGSEERLDPERVLGERWVAKLGGRARIDVNVQDILDALGATDE